MKKIICLLLFFCVLPAFASPSDALVQRLNHYKTYQAKFMQTSTNRVGGGPAVLRGVLYLQRPGKFRWQAGGQIPQIIIANGTKLVIYYPDLQQASIQTISQTPQNPAALLSGDVNTILNHYQVSEKNKWYVLTAKDKNSAFREVRLRFKGEKLVAMQVANALNQRNTYYFSHIKINQPIAAKLFEFKPAANVTVMKQ